MFDVVRASRELIDQIIADPRGPMSDEDRNLIIRALNCLIDVNRAGSGSGDASGSYSGTGSAYYTGRE